MRHMIIMLNFFCPWMISAQLHHPTISISASGWFLNMLQSFYFFDMEGKQGFNFAIQFLFDMEDFTCKCICNIILIHIILKK